MEILAVALYLNGKPPGWVPRAYDIKKRFGIGKEKWERISKLMRELGLLHDVQTQQGKQLVFQLRCEITPLTEEVSQGRETRPSGNPTIRVPAHIERKTPTKKDILKTHDHEQIKNQNESESKKPQKPPISIREAALSCDDKYMYEKLRGFPGMFAGVAMAIVEQHTVGHINNLLEIAIRDGVKNPGSYVVRCLYNKSASA